MRKVLRLGTSIFLLSVMVIAVNVVLLFSRAGGLNNKGENLDWTEPYGFSTENGELEKLEVKEEEEKDRPSENKAFPADPSPLPSPGREEESSYPNAGQGEGNATDSKEEYVLTYEELKAAQNLSLGDKLIGLGFVGKLSKEDINRILTLANGGITVREMVKVEEILSKSLSSKDMEKLNEMIQRNKALYARMIIKNSPSP